MDHFLKIDRFWVDPVLINTVDIKYTNITIQ